MIEQAQLTKQEQKSMFSIINIVSWNLSLQQVWASAAKQYKSLAKCIHLPKGTNIGHIPPSIK